MCLRWLVLSSPVPIMLLVPIRQFIMPGMFSRTALAVLDPMPGDQREAPNVDRSAGGDTSAIASS